MPVYEYDCGTCGSFTLFRPLHQSSQPAECPDCGLVAEKVFPVVHLAAMRPEKRKAWERNDRSAHQPHVCGSGCSHQSIKTNAKPKDRNGKPALEFSKKQNSRPWMLGH
jgi:putative FmdB family regulatory protein